MNAEPVLLRDFPLAKRSSMRTGGIASFASFPQSKAELTDVLAYCGKNGIRSLVIGNASNTLFDDGGFDGCVVFTGDCRAVTVNNGVIDCECGLSLSALSTQALENGLTGLEFAYGIPGTVGGGVYMNAGCYGGQLSDVFLSCECVSPSGEVKTLYAGDMDFGYRKCVLQRNGYTLLSAAFRLGVGVKDEIKAVMERNMAARREKQPLEYPSCGSVFKRPVGHYAGALIEQCGLKGASVGGAEVSEKHAGFIINKGNATSGDVLSLIELIQRRVKDETGVTLEPEIQIIRK